MAIVDVTVNNCPCNSKVSASGGICLLVGIDTQYNVYTSHAMVITGHRWRDTWLRGRLHRFDLSIC